MNDSLLTFSSQAVSSVKFKSRSKVSTPLLFWAKKKLLLDKKEAPVRGPSFFCGERSPFNEKEGLLFWKRRASFSEKTARLFDFETPHSLLEYLEDLEVDAFEIFNTSLHTFTQRKIN